MSEGSSFIQQHSAFVYNKDIFALTSRRQRQTSSILIYSVFKH